ncbi:MAG: TonB-dependent receptor [Gemmatimonadetes bacterium]|jgi:iron complex outermembrane recepter protein|nr:TonB-dependent receptor [Gemmatimonadota bacterium]MBT6146194.1 TonB-dependent receptor [Gemmatimonadota bacterium]MBT7863947.1 TonB-dependent receptor [Gemmatimonadota bacterium]
MIPRLGWVLAILMCGVRPADAALIDLSLDELMDLEVTLVSRRPQLLAETPAAVIVLTGDELRRAGVRSLPDALRLVPGFQVGQVDANKWVVTSRGFAGLFANKLLVLVDGRSVYTPLFSGVFWESQGVFMEDVERLEVIRGPGGALWGANAVNGIVNVITKPAGDTAQTFVEMGAGNERRQVAFRHGRQIRGGNLRIDAERIDRSRTTGAGDLPVRDDWRMHRVGFRADFETDTGHELTFLGSARGGSVGQSVTYVAQPVPALATTQYFDADLFAVDLLGRWRRQWSQDHVLEAQAYVDLFDREERVLKGRIHNADIDIQHRLRKGGHNWVWGAGYRRTWDDFDGTFTMWLEPAARTTHLVSGFIHDDVEISPGRLSLSGGTKLEHNSYSGWEWQPNLSLWFAPIDDVSMWAAVSRAVRTPSRGDQDFHAAVGAIPSDSLYSGAPEAVVALLGGTEVVAENLLAIDTGLRLPLGGRGFVDVTWFHYEYDDVATHEPGFPYTIEDRGPTHLVVPLYGANLAQATAKGMEILLDWALTPIWQIRGSYTYLDLDTRLDAESLATTADGFYENDSPTHQVGVRSQLSRGPWSLAVSGRWVAQLPGPLPNIPSYLDANGRLAYTWPSGLEVAISGANLLKSSHREAVSNSVGAVPTRVPREIFVSLGWRQ